MGWGVQFGWTTALACFCLILISVWWKSKSTKNLPPGPTTGLPLIGYVLSAEPFKDLFHLGKLYGRRHHKVVSVRLGKCTVVVLNSYEAVQEAFVKKAEYSSGRPASFANKFNQGKGISLSSGVPWKEQRTFFLKTMRQFGVGTKRLEDRIQSEISSLLERVDMVAKGGKSFDIKPLLMNSVANILCSISVGKKYDWDDPEFMQLISSMENIFQEAGAVAPQNYTPYIINYFLVKFSPRLKRLAASYKYMYTYAHDMKKKLKTEFDGEEVKHYVDAFFKEAQKASSSSTTFADEDYLVTNIVTMFNAGTDTVTMTLTWMILYMVLYPSVQSRVQKELDTVLENDRRPTLADEPDLPYTCAMLREVQRIAVVAPLAVIHATTKDATLFGYDIPVGTRVIANLWAVMHDPDNWSDPEVFKPERFLDDNGKVVSFQKLIQFGSGRRKCPGENMAKMELFLFTTSLLQLYRFQLPSNYLKSSNNLTKGKSGITFSPKPFEIIADRRK